MDFTTPFIKFNHPAPPAFIEGLLTMNEPEPRIYKIVRFREGGASRVIKKNVTLTEAKNHCSDPQTRGVRAGRRWFDGFEYMPGCRPKND
jgi:hypothetical protein